MRDMKFCCFDFFVINLSIILNPKHRQWRYTGNFLRSCLWRKALNDSIQSPWYVSPAPSNVIYGSRRWGSNVESWCTRNWVSDLSVIIVCAKEDNYGSEQCIWSSDIIINSNKKFVFTQCDWSHSNVWNKVVYHSREIRDIKCFLD